jgi:hypothetical protein
MLRISRIHLLDINTLFTSLVLIVLEVCDMSPRLPLNGLSPFSERGMWWGYLETCLKTWTYHFLKHEVMIALVVIIQVFGFVENE